MSYDDQVAEVESGRSGPSWKLIALMLVVAGLAVFFFQNGQDGEVNFLWFDGTLPQWALIGIAVVAGVILDRLATWQWRRARSRRT